MTFVQDIANGVHDSDFDQIARAIKARKLLVATTTINVGDTVTLSGLTPKYINGKAVIVRKVNAKSIVVDFPADRAYGRFAGSRGVRCPITNATVA
jgi:hypothetical protein